MSEQQKRTCHPLNVLGPFYVDVACCTLCGVPQGEAPDLFGESDKPAGCYVKRQPGGPEELARMLAVQASQDLDCVRYRGPTNTPAWGRLRRAGLVELIDPPSPEGLV